MFTPDRSALLESTAATIGWIANCSPATAALLGWAAKTVAVVLTAHETST